MVVLWGSGLDHWVRLVMYIIVYLEPIFGHFPLPKYAAEFTVGFLGIHTPESRPLIA